MKLENNQLQRKLEHFSMFLECTKMLLEMIKKLKTEFLIIKMIKNFQAQNLQEKSTHSKDYLIEIE